MVMQAKAIGKDTDRVIGYLTWWTIHKKAYSVQGLLDGARRAGLDNYVTDRIKGRNPLSAFIAATQTGTRGLLIDSVPDREERLLTREAAPNARSAQPRRALVYQVTKLAEETQDVVTSKTAAIVEYAPHQTDHCRVKMALWAHAHRRVVRAVEDIRDRVATLVGTMDDSRIRAIVIGWLKLRYRITVRGTGGVYFVPAPSDRAERNLLEKELMAMREWLSGISAPFSVVALNESGALSIDDFVTDAVNEIETELRDVAEKLDKWEGNANMNSGSRMFSSQTQFKRVVGLRAKAQVLKDSLGERIGVVDAMVGLLIGRIERMVTESTTAVQQVKQQRELAKRASRSKGEAGKKAGTVTARAKVRKIQ